MKTTSNLATAKTKRMAKASATRKRPSRSKPAKPSATTGRPSPGGARITKGQRCLDLLIAPNGATIVELQAATDWQAHSVRGFLAGTVKKKLGLIVESKKAENGIRRYRVVQVGA